MFERIEMNINIFFSLFNLQNDANHLFSIGPKKKQINGNFVPITQKNKTFFIRPIG